MSFRIQTQTESPPPEFVARPYEGVSQNPAMGLFFVRQYLGHLQNLPMYHGTATRDTYVGRWDGVKLKN